MMRVDWPLVGRGGELRLLTGLMRARAGNSVVLAGSAGVGKTRLLLECLSAAEASALPTARVAATRSAAHLPFGAFAPLLPPPDPESVEAPEGVGDEVTDGDGVRLRVRYSGPRSVGEFCDAT